MAGLPIKERGIDTRPGSRIRGLKHCISTLVISILHVFLEAVSVRKKAQKRTPGYMYPKNYFADHLQNGVAGFSSRSDLGDPQSLKRHFFTLPFLSGVCLDLKNRATCLVQYAFGRRLLSKRSILNDTLGRHRFNGVLRPVTYVQRNYYQCRKEPDPYRNCGGWGSRRALYRRPE